MAQRIDPPPLFPPDSTTEWELSSGKRGGFIAMGKRQPRFSLGGDFFKRHLLDALVTGQTNDQESNSESSASTSPGHLEGFIALQGITSLQPA